jgi:hypothetical protein
MTPHQCARDLLGAVHVRVVHVQAGVAGDKVVGERLARIDRRLDEGGDTIHGVRDVEPVEVDRGRLVQFVLQADADLIALGDADLGGGDGAAIRPGLGHLPRREFPLHDLRSDIEDLDPILDGEELIRISPGAKLA